MCWLTESHTIGMMQAFSQSLALRLAIFEMAGLSTAEKEGRPDLLLPVLIETNSLQPRQLVLSDFVRVNIGAS
jgi:hypothetical protein